MGSGGLNLGLHACKARTLATETPASLHTHTHTRTVIFIIKQLSEVKQNYTYYSFSTPSLRLPSLCVCVYMCFCVKMLAHPHASMHACVHAGGNVASRTFSIDKHFFTSF